MWGIAKFEIEINSLIQLLIERSELRNWRS